MDTLDILETIKEDIGGQITDEDLREWANQLTKAICYSENIEWAAGETINTLIHESKQANFRAGCTHYATHNKILLGRYFNLLRFVIDSLNIENGQEVLEHCRNVINGTNEQSRPKAHLTPKKHQQTEREEKYFAKALDFGLMKRTKTGYEWIYQNGRKASLGYFLNKVFNPKMTAQIPYKRMENLFNVSRLDTALGQALNAKEHQKWRKEIDSLFDD